MNYTFYFYSSTGITVMRAEYRTDVGAIKFGKKAMKEDDFALAIENREGEVIFQYDKEEEKKKK